MAWYQSDAEVPEHLTFGSFLIRPIRGNDAPADHAALMAARHAIRAHGESDFPRDDFSVDEDREDLDADARRHDATEAFTFAIVGQGDEIAGCLYVWPATAQLERYGEGDLAAKMGAGAASVEWWLRPELIAALVDEQLVAAVRDWLTTAWSFPQVVWITRGHETRPRALLEQLGLRPVEPVGPDPSALVIYS